MHPFVLRWIFQGLVWGEIDNKTQALIKKNIRLIIANN